MFLKEPEIINSNIKIKGMGLDLTREFPLDIHSIEEVELEELTDQEKKVEDTEMLVMSRISSIKTNIKKLPKKYLLKLLKKYQLNNPNLKNHKSSLLLNIIKAKVSISTLPLPKRRLQSKVKLTLNGSRRRS